MITVDFETRSRADLKKVGTYVYATHPSTEVLCLAWTYDDSGEAFLWHPAFPNAYRSRTTSSGKRSPISDPEPLEANVIGGWSALDELIRRIKDGEPVEAHNALFERCIWQYTLRRLHDWAPPVRPDQWRCSAALAASYALPRSLAAAAKALGLTQRKDETGHRLMLRLSQPARPTKRYPDRQWYEDVADLEAVFEYCRQDVRVERALSRALPPLDPTELRSWQQDQEINLRGVYCDAALAEKALILAEDEITRAGQRIAELTNNAATSPTQRDKILKWVHGRGVNLPNLRSELLEGILNGDGEWDGAALPPDVLAVLRYRLEASRTSTKKYEAMLNRISEDGRIRDTLRFHAASTGRWGGVGIQLQNFPRGTVTGVSMERLCADILDYEADELHLLHGDVMGALASALRGALCAPPGKRLIVADYAAIEARGVFWLASEEKALRLMAEGGDIYKDMASDVYGVPYEEVTKAQRQMGKQAVLGLGYQMGARKFALTCGSYGIDVPLDAPEALHRLIPEKDYRAALEEGTRGHSNADAGVAWEQYAESILARIAPSTITATQVVRTYRWKYQGVTRLWKALEHAAIQAVNSQATETAPIVTHRTAWWVEHGFLFCRLPSGRRLAYFQPSVEMEPAPWDHSQLLPKLKFMGLGRTYQWERQTTYGGKLTENVVQALCRDLLRDALLRIEDRRGETYSIVFHAHDEIVAEAPEGEGSVEEFEQLMAEIPAWAEGMPVSAEGWEGGRYRK